MSREYDLILVMTTFRRATVYLPIIKELSSRFRIGLYIFDIPEKVKIKTLQTDKIFLDLCCQLGAEIVRDTPVKARLSIIPQWPYTPEQISTMKDSIQCGHKFALMGLMWGNLHLDKMRQLAIDKYLIIDKDIYKFRLEKRKHEREYNINLQNLVETGLPFLRYPVFEDFGIDYLIAHPSPLSLPEAKDKYNYLKCLLKLLASIDRTEKIILKPHNGDERYDYLLNKRMVNCLMKRGVFLFDGVIFWCAKTLLCLLNSMRWLALCKMKNILYDVLIVLYYKKLLKKVVLLKSITPYHNFSLEIFLPHAKKGLITGRSNSIWHALLLKKAVYNCVDKNTIKENKEKMNYYSMQYFEVPYCRGKLIFDEKYFGIIRDEVRTRDMIRFLDEVLSFKKVLKAQTKEMHFMEP
ncbi:MAG: hypothetical protein JSW40_08940 [Candidatus Omnitrophota bacterium]|nr:MAG: hypothetical protein JSW40_08940 [Candidatus Omnitrophota bacterium]